jgi:hypothetical protein
MCPYYSYLTVISKSKLRKEFLELAQSQSVSTYSEGSNSKS